MNWHEPSRDQMQLHVVEAAEQDTNVTGREHLQVRRVVLGLVPSEEAKPVLQAVGVRHGTDERAAGSEYPQHFGGDAPWIPQMLEELAGDDDVEGAVLERQRIVEVGPAGLDPDLLRLGERLAVGVDADDLVSAGVGLRERAVAAAEIEHVPPRPADVAAEELDPLGAREDEAGAALDAVVLGVPLAQLF